MNEKIIATIKWLGKAKILFVVVLMMISTLYYLVSSGFSSKSVTSVGVVYQLFGFSMSFVQISSNRKKFCAKNIFQVIIDLIDERPFFVKKKNFDITASGNLTLPGIGVYAFASRNGTLEEKLDDLKSFVFEFNQRYLVERDNFLTSLSNVKDNFQSEIALMNERIENLRKEVSELAIGGGHIPYVEIFFFVVGTVMSTLPDKCISWFKYIFS